MQNSISIDSLSAFYSILKTKVSFINQVKKHYSKVLASDFNSLDFYYVGENKVSEILCFLLNPLGSHGQEDVFLKLFLKKFEIIFEYEDLQDVSAVTEKITDNNRRIDIFLHNKKSTSLIAIENKIYSGTTDQHNQVNDYLQYILNFTREEKFTFIYLAPKGKEISNNSFNKETYDNLVRSGKVKFINYEDDIIPLIHQFAISAENDRVRAFILDYERKLKNLYMGNSELNETDIIKEYIIDNSKNIELSFQIFKNINDAKLELRALFLAQLKEISHELNIFFDEINYRYHLDKLGDNLVGISYESGGIFFGIVRKTDSKDERKFPQIEQYLNGNIQRSYWWPVYFWLFRNIETNPDFWIAVKNGEAKNTIKVFLQTLIESQFDINADVNHLK